MDHKLLEKTPAGAAAPTAAIKSVPLDAIPNSAAQPLHTRRLSHGAALAQARPATMDPVTLDSPALKVMTDLTQVRAATVGPATTLKQAERIMMYLGVRMLFVVSAMPTIEGLITFTDLEGDRPMRVVQQRNLRHDELTVADVMTPLVAMDAISYHDVRHARVENLIATLQHDGRNHLLVVDQPSHDGRDAEALPHTEGGRVRGVISRAQIERQLGRPIEVTEIAHSFAELGLMLT